MGNQTIIDLFAGPGIGGWDTGLAMIGRTDVLGIEWDESACLTAEAAGHKRLRADVAALNPRDYIGAEGLIASPPCQAWSLAGKRGGEEDRAACHELADRMAAGDDSTDWREWTDERSPLVCQPVRWARELRPEWIALEEVPAVLGLWEHMARIFRAWGYSVWVGTLLAADYGVPQTRTRAILMASRVRTVTPPEPTHAEHPEGVDLFGGHREKWISMAEALGWAAGDMIRPARGQGMIERHGERPDHPADGPAPTIISKSRSWERISDQPAPTIVTTRRSKDGLIVGRQLPPGEGENVGGWGWLRGSNQANAAIRGPHEPAPTMLFGHCSNDVAWYPSREAAKPGQQMSAAERNAAWAEHRPSTTVAADPHIADPGYRKGNERQFRPDGIRVTVQEAGVLQSFPADYPWDGLALADHVVRVGFPVVADHAQTDELVREALERGVRFTVLGGGGEDSQVLDGIVRPISVDVVDNLTRLRCGDRAVLRHGAAATEDGISAAEVGVALSTLVRVERVTRQSPLLPVPGAEATGDGFAFTVVARWLGGVDELISCPPALHPLVVHEAQTLRRVLPAATFDLASSHVSSVAERVARHTNSRTKQYEQCGNAVPPLLAAHVLAALGVGSITGRAAA